MDDLLDLLMDYSKRKKKANAVFFGKAATSIITLLDLDDEVQELNLHDKFDDDMDKDKFVLMFYSTSSHAIEISKKGLKLCFSGFSKDFLRDDEFDDFSLGEYRILFYNSYILARLLHEFEHARQFKLARGSDDFESALFNILYAPVLMNSEDNDYDWFAQNDEYARVYVKNYDGVPEEKLADIKSYQKVLEILKPIISSIPDIEYYYALLMYNRYMDGYEKCGELITSPTSKYLTDLYEISNDLIRKRCFNDEFRRLFEEKCDSSLFERMSYGLPISFGEYTYMSDFRECDKVKALGVRK